ncbi:MAG TPA: TolC family protein [Ignavibacteria bacterium]|nr:TolC family protein [Ignavibacteria bacterium]
MFKLKTAVFITFFVFLSQLSISQTTEISLREAIQNAYKNNVNIVKTQYSIESQEFSIKESYGNLLPDLTFSTGWTRTNQITKAGQRAIGGVVFQVPEQNTTTDVFDLTLRSNVTIFDGLTNYDNIDLQKKTQRRLTILLEKYKQDAAIKVLTDYITVLKNDQVVIINQATLEDSKAQLDKIKIFVEVGKRTLADVYKQDVVVAQNELTVEQAKNEYNKSIADLAFSSNLPIEKTYSVKKDEFVTALSYESLENYVYVHSNIQNLVNNSLKNRYDYKSTVYNLGILQTNLDIAQGLLLFPTLTGFGNYSVSGNKIDKITNQRVFTIGLTLTYPIFQGFSVDKQKQQAIINYRSAEEDIKLLKNQIELDIKKAVLDLKSLLKQIEISDRNLKSAEQDKLLAEESYRIGLVTLLEVNTATTNLNNILIQKSNLIYNFILAQKTLEYYQGLLKY